MRILLPSRMLPLVALAVGLFSPAQADDSVVHLREDTPAGQTISHLGKALQLQSHERVRFVDGHNGRFQIIDGDRLVVGPRAGLDHETQPEHRLNLRIVAASDLDAPDGDRLEEKFSDLLGDSPSRKHADGDQPAADRQNAADEADGAGVDAAGGRSVTIRVVVDDVAESPLLLGSRFRIAAWTTPLPGQRIGRAIVIDLDDDEQHHFELVEGGELVRIDPATGELFLRDDADPSSVAALQVVVRVTDKTGLVAQACYPVWLNQCPPAPPLPVLLADNTPTAESTAVAVVESRLPGSATPVVKVHQADDQSHRDAPAAISKSPLAGAAATPQEAHHVPRLALEPTQHLWMSRLRELVSSLDGGLWGTNSSGWLITVAALMCVAIIVISGVRDAVLAGHRGAEVPRPAVEITSGTEGPSVRQPLLRSPDEIAGILARLDAIIGKTEHAAGDVESLETAGAEASPDDEQVVGTAAVALTTDVDSPLLDCAETATIATVPATAVLAEPTPQTETVLATTPAPHEYGSELIDRQLTGDERRQIEQFRQISRTINRADIGRHHRERMRREWLSIGVTALACVVTGTVCMFTGCFGAMSVPVSSVMLSVAAVLLIRPSLYPQLPQDNAPE